MNEVWKKLFSRLGIEAGDDTNDDQAIELIATKFHKVAPSTAPASKGILDLLELPDTSTEEEAVGAILALKHPGNVVTVDQHQDLEKQMRTHALDTLVAGAMQTGKLTPAEKQWAYDQVSDWDKAGKDGLAIMKNFIERRPKVAPIGERLPVKAKHDTDIDEEQEMINRRMGVSREDFAKYAH